MRHEHLVVTVEAETKERIDDDLEPGESLEAWVADAVERKLADGSDDPLDPAGGEERAVDPAEPLGGEPDDRLDPADGEESDDYDEGFEYVDDCGI